MMKLSHSIVGSIAMGLLFFLGIDFYISSVALIREVPTEDSSLRLAMHVRDEKLGWKPISNAIRAHILPGNFSTSYEFDESGFKKVYGNQTKPRRSIYFFGDSFTFGFGLSNRESFPNLIKEFNLNSNVNVYNTAVMGYGITQMYQQFLMLKSRLRPGDLIVLAPLAEDIDRSLRSIYFPYMLAFDNAFAFDTYPYFDGNEVRTEPITKTFIHKIETLALSARRTGKLWRWINSQLDGSTTVESLKMIELMRNQAKDMGVQFTVVFLPLPEECEAGKYSIPINQFDYLDIMKAFPKTPAELTKIHFKNNGHWNASGHLIAAKAITEILLQKGFLKKEDLLGHLE